MFSFIEKVVREFLATVGWSFVFSMIIGTLTRFPILFIGNVSGFDLWIVNSHSQVTFFSLVPVIIIAWFVWLVVWGVVLFCLTSIISVFFLERQIINLDARKLYFEYTHISVALVSVLLLIFWDSLFGPW